MQYDEYAARLREQAERGRVELAEYGEVVENGRRHPLFSATVPGGARRLVITTGFHGEEPAGPLTMAAHLAEIAGWVREAGITAHIFPCINPSGFEAGSRYNASGEKPNNDFLRY